jgi:hypothetical protein
MLVVREEENLWLLTSSNKIHRFVPDTGGSELLTEAISQRTPEVVQTQIIH